MLIPYYPEPKFEFSTSVVLDGNSYKIDFKKFREGISKLSKEAADSWTKESGAICTCGCAPHFYLTQLKTYSKMYEGNDDQKFQRISPCSRESDGTLSCMSGPELWTTRGWQDFGIVLLNKLDDKDIDFLNADKTSIDISKIIAYLKS